MQMLLAMATGLGRVLMVRPSSGLLTIRCSWPCPQGCVRSSMFVLHQDSSYAHAPGHGHRVGSSLRGSSFIKTADMHVLLAMDTGLGRVLIVRSSSG